MVLNLQGYARRAPRPADLPPVFFVELTRNCDPHRRMCHSAGPSGPDLDMTEEIFDRIAELLFPTAAMVDLRGWGE